MLEVSRRGSDAWVRRPPSTGAMRRLERMRAIGTTAPARYGSPKSAAPLRREGTELTARPGRA
ncbi:MAG: hypothetical protein ACP5QO_11270 [Clostridia bacterium]